MKAKQRGITTTPVKITQPILDFCRTISESLPLNIPVKPLPNGEFSKCFVNVTNKVAADGGKMVTGWAIWEMPFSFIEAEHHAVWMSDAGALFDVTPKEDGEDKILFLSDPSAAYVEGVRQPKRKRALRDHQAIHDFIRLSLKREAMMPPPGVTIQVTPEFVQIDRRCGELSLDLMRMMIVRVKSRKKR